MRDRIARTTRRGGLEALVLGLAALALYTWRLDRNGWANEYYAAAARSMSTSWHAFWFASFDAVGVQSLDKPPLASWLQALSVRALGFDSWALLLPQAIAGALTVLLAWDLARRAFGRVAGVVAGLALLATPIATAMSRHDNPDALLALCCTAAAWCAVRAASTGRLRWAALAGVAVGLGFATKLAAALLVVPGIALALILVGEAGWRRRAGLTSAFVAAAAVVGAAWPVSVALTSSGSRPWLSGTSDDSITSLIVGYNGTGRVAGQAGGPGGGFGGGGGIFGGDPGLLRLFNSSLGGQSGWFLGLAVAALVLAATTSRGRRDPRTAWLLVVGGWLLTVGVVFSAARGIFHPYYVAQLAPAAALLTGAAAGLLLEARRDLRVLVPTLVGAGAAGQLLVDAARGDAGTHALAVLIAAGGCAAVAAATDSRRVLLTSAAAAALVLAWTPLSWSVATLGHATAGTFPTGGSSSTATTAGGGGGMFGSTSALTQARAWIQAQEDAAGTLVVSSQSTAAPAVIAGAEDVVAIGGFSGNESEVTLDWFADRVAAGDVRWVLTSEDGGGAPSSGRTGARAVMAAVADTCTAATGDDAPAGLYDCSDAADALRAAA